MAIVLVTSIISISAATTTENNPDKVKITFVPKAQTKAIEEYVTQNNIVLDSFVVTASVGSENLSSGYIINNPAEFDVLWSDFVSTQKALLTEGITRNNENDSSVEMQEMLDALLSNKIQLSITCNEPSLKMRSGNYLNSELIENIEYIEAATSYKEEDAISLAASASNWVPTSGYASAWPSNNVEDATYMDVHYQWDAAESLSTLTSKSDSTLEADLVFYNYDGTAISNAWYSGNYTYSTNQPNPYQDTKAFDNSNEAVFSIGCSKASALEAEKDYYWIALGNQTGSTGCKAKLNFQRGHRFINSLYEETWNIFGDETVTVIPFSSWNTGDNGRAYFGGDE